ncbi:MAG TPA: LytTR family DNA-binding domain-containing protein [Frateuria sp.]|uniref:LytR/AlgR family response regulator transcription factor n=1 Tax=Frateuria sp. TaxID=2211372 RepID=UPI002D7FA808|nr:LytTR family DNA-binding domain-containing protein [Frateuria sp.]HET6806585.1 LytTR family DNA-binding domain-containing protein [Frateuria sp.]
MTAPLRVLVVDDEAPAQRVLVRMLQAAPGVEVAGIAGDGMDALDVLAHERIDLMLLDIEMPRMAGIELAARLSPTPAPAVVFVTAWPQYAVRAFELQVADYLLKPVRPERLAQALERARAQLAADTAAQRIGTLEASLLALREGVPDTRGSQVWVEWGTGRLRLALEDIEWFAADGDYVQAHTAERGYLMRDALNRLETSLPVGRFVRVHRSTLVNLAAVVRVGNAANGQLLLTTRSGATLAVGRRAKTRVKDILGA